MVGCGSQIMLNELVYETAMKWRRQDIPICPKRHLGCDGFVPAALQDLKSHYVEQLHRSHGKSWIRHRRSYTLLESIMRNSNIDLRRQNVPWAYIGAQQSPTNGIHWRVQGAPPVSAPLSIQIPSFLHTNFPQRHHVRPWCPPRGRRPPSRNPGSATGTPGTVWHRGCGWPVTPDKG